MLRSRTASEAKCWVPKEGTRPCVERYNRNNPQSILQGEFRQARLVSLAAGSIGITLWKG